MVAARTMTGADYWVVPALLQDQPQEASGKHEMLKQQDRKRSSTTSYVHFEIAALHKNL